MTTLKTKTSDLTESLRQHIAQFFNRNLFSLNIDTPPVPAARPRVGKWGTYYPKTYTAWMKAAGMAVSSADVKEFHTGPLVAVVEQVCHTPKTTKREHPRGDADNYAKGPLDVVTKLGKVWEDDDQVVLLIASKRYAEDNETPGTRMSWIPMEEV